MLRRCAHSITEDEYKHAVDALQSSVEWKTSPKLRAWFSRKWIPEYKVNSSILSIVMYI